MEKVLMKGNEALAEAAIRAGCKCFFGYPITPQTELSEYLAKQMPKRGGVFLQAESEVAAINMVLGAAGTGTRVMTSSSSPGISLKSEGISYIAGSDVPCLIVNVERGGPGLGSIQPSQQDYWQATKGLGHGDFRLENPHDPVTHEATVPYTGRHRMDDVVGAEDGERDYNAGTHSIRLTAEQLAQIERAKEKAGVK